MAHYCLTFQKERQEEMSPSRRSLTLSPLCLSVQALLRSRPDDVESFSWGTRSKASVEWLGPRV